MPNDVDIKRVRWYRELLSFIKILWYQIELSMKGWWQIDMNEIVKNKTKRGYMLEQLRFDEGTLQHKEEGNFDVNISGSKSDRVLAGAAAKIATAEEEAVDSVRDLACCGVVETAGESCCGWR